MNVHVPLNLTGLHVALTLLNKAALTVLVRRTLSVFLDQKKHRGYLFLLGRTYVSTTQFPEIKSLVSK